MESSSGSSQPPSPQPAGRRLEEAAAALAQATAVESRDAEVVVEDRRRGGSETVISPAVGEALVAALERLVAAARAETTAAREELAARTAGEAALVAAAGGLRLQLDELRERVAARDERDQRVARLVVEVADAAQAAREEIGRQIAARERAEAGWAAARERVAVLATELAAARSQLPPGQAVAGAARPALKPAGPGPARPLAELEAARAAQARLQSGPVDDGGEEREDADALVDELMQAAQRLRDQAAPEATSGVARADGEQAAADDPVIDVPAGGESPAGQQGAGEPPAGQQSAGEPAADASTAAQRMADEPAAGEPATERGPAEPSAPPPEPPGDPAPAAPEGERRSFMRRLFGRRD